MAWQASLRTLLIVLLAGSIGTSGLYAQSGTNRRGSNNEAAANEDETVKTVKVDDTPNAAGTQSGESEGVVPAPEFTPEPDKEQRAEDVTAVDDGATSPSGQNGGRSDAASETHATTRLNGRTMALLIPAPRGQILDRHGEPLAQTQVAYQLALRFGQFENEDRDSIVAFARKCLDEAHKIAEQTWEFSDEKLWDHYRHRRWLPLPVTNVIRAEAAEKIREKVSAVKGLELLPIYIRFYPESKIGAHMVGYVGSRGKLPTGPINHMDPLWERVEGKSGLEKEFNSQLTGKPGIWRLMFDEEGTKILDELQVKPRPGGSIVTTLDLKWQKEAERVLSKGARRGAMVVVDCKTGEVLVMASTPSYDPNMFIPNISQKNYDALRNDPANPLVSRAFQGKYPPASTFKVVTVLSALANGTLTENQTVYCPASIQIGNHTFNNWSKTPAGSINCIRGLAMSNNPFMYQIALNLDGRQGRNAPLCARYLLDAAKKLGFGSVTGLPIPDQAGLVPDEDYMISAFRRNFMQGDIANMSIGQGVLLATPLQVAHAMAGIANGYGLPKLHLVKQVQDGNANVIYSAVSEIQTPLTEYEKAAAIVRKGMRAVIEGGTGSRAKLSYTSIAGKTGTAQWGPERENRRLAWFAGFMPCDNPRFAYAVLYEGLPNEKIGGGAKAAPIVKEFFESIKKDVKDILNPPGDDSIPVAEPVDDIPADTAPVDHDIPDGLPAGLYDPNDVQPVPVQAIPLDIDDSADVPAAPAQAPAQTPARVPSGGYGSQQDYGQEASVPAYAPQPGDADYIPGLSEQIPRHLSHPVSTGEKRMPPPVRPADNIPIATPVLAD